MRFRVGGPAGLLFPTRFFLGLPLSHLYPPPIFVYTNRRIDLRGDRRLSSAKRGGRAYPKRSGSEGLKFPNDVGPVIHHHNFRGKEREAVNTCGEVYRHVVMRLKKKLPCVCVVGSIVSLNQCISCRGISINADFRNEGL